MSPQKSSLAFEDIEGFEGHGSMVQEPELYVIEPRHMLRSKTLASHSTLDEVIAIRGRFTVSF